MTVPVQDRVKGNVKPLVRRQLLTAKDREVFSYDPSIRKPDWDNLQPTSFSNTFGSGVALKPSVMETERIERVRTARKSTFESGTDVSFGARIVRRAGMVVRSKGGLLVSLSALVLSLGLSPMVTDNSSTASSPTSDVVAVSTAQ